MFTNIHLLIYTYVVYIQQQQQEKYLPTNLCKLILPHFNENYRLITYFISNEFMYPRHPYTQIIHLYTNTDTHTHTHGKYCSCLYIIKFVAFINI